MIRGFSPLAAIDARVLILGTVPSERSLAEGQYYAHARSCFWLLMERLFGEGKPLEYPDRVALLLRSGVAVWDVLRAAERQGREVVGRCAWSRRAGGAEQAATIPP